MDVDYEGQTKNKDLNVYASVVVVGAAVLDDTRIVEDGVVAADYNDPLDVVNETQRPVKDPYSLQRSMMMC